MNEYDSIITAGSALLREDVTAQPIRNYLDKRISRRAQEKWGFGYFPNSENINALFTLVGEDILTTAKVRYDQRTYNGLPQKIVKSSFENHNLIMPYRDVYGNIVAIVGRTLLSDEDQKERGIAKYNNTSFKKGRHLFGLFEARQSILRRDCVFVVEGQFDCIQASDVEIDNIVAVGSHSLTGEQLALLKRYTNNIYLMFDNDEAGRDGVKHAIQNHGAWAAIMPKFVPAGYKDLDEYIRDNKNISYKDLIAL